MADMTRRRALALMVGGLVGGAAFAAGCGSGDQATSSRRSQGSGLVSDPPDRPAEGEAVIYASPTCACCGDYAAYLESEGWAVQVRRTDGMDAVKADAGVPDEARSCHTSKVGDYAVEGHVPIEAIDKLLRERPAVDGIALPGMPPGSPGMGGTKAGPFEIVSFGAGASAPFMTL